MKQIEPIRSTDRAAVLLAHPLRTRILAHARVPVSGSDLARHLEQPRQRVGYHVRQLAQAGFLLPVAQQKKRNMVEQQYIASAHSYVLTAELLGVLAPELSDSADLLTVCAHAQAELAAVVDAAQNAGLRLRTYAHRSAVYFASAEERTEFIEELSDAIEAVVESYGTPVGRPFHFIAGLYPAPELK